MAPALARAEVNDDESIATFGTAIGDVGDALAGAGEVSAQVETHVVDVAVRESDVLWEEDGLEDTVVLEVNSDKLRPTIRGEDEIPIGRQDAPGVEDPEPVESVDYY